MEEKTVTGNKLIKILNHDKRKIVERPLSNICHKNSVKKRSPNGKDNGRKRKEDKNMPLKLGRKRATL